MNAQEALLAALKAQFHWVAIFSDDADQVRTALDAAGFAIVPKVPTTEMLAAAEKPSHFSRSAEKHWFNMTTTASKP